MALTPTTRLTLSTTLALTLAAIVLLTLLGHNRLTDWDEAIYAAISRSMLTSGWLVPHFNAQPWLEKPPLMLWITAAFFRLFGVSELTARLGSALSGVAIVGLLHAWLNLRRNALTAWLSTVILLSTFGFLHVARVGEMDVLLSLACTLSLIALCELNRASSSTQPAHTQPAWLLFWSGFAIAVMTKGAASITLAITLVLAVALCAELRRALSSSLFWIGSLLFLAIVLPWHLYILHRFGHIFLDQYLGLHVLTRATTQIEGHLTPWYFYLRVLLVSAAPWVLLYPFTLYDTLTNTGRPVHARFLRMSGRPQKPAAVQTTNLGWPIHARSLRMSGEPQKPQEPQTLRPFALFALTTLTLFTLAQTRLPHYIAPTYPALSVLTAAWLADRLAATNRKRALQLAAAAIAIYLAAAAITAAPRRALHSPHLPTGQTTPDNREQIALLKQIFQHPTPLIADTPGPLLTLRTGTYNPIPTTVFYAARPVQQTILTPQPPSTPTDIYTNNPVPLTLALAHHQPHLLMADRTLIPQLPANITFQPLATSATLTLGLAAMR